jgi:hypothetical protein
MHKIRIVRLCSSWSAKSCYYAPNKSNAHQFYLNYGHAQTIVTQNRKSGQKLA